MSNQDRALSRLRGLLIDLDGVIYRGNTALPGVPEFFRTLKELGMPYVLLTNNSTLTTFQFVEKVRPMGVPAGEREVISSAEATADFLADEAPLGTGVFVLGETGLREAVRSRGFDLDAPDPRYVVVGMDRELTFQKLHRACAAVFAGARLVGSNPDKTLPTESGLVPGCGTLLAAIQACTEVEPVIIGKPEPRMLHLGARRMGLPLEAVAMVGDRLDTDIVAGAKAGVKTVLLLTGISSREDIETFPIRPDHVFTDLPELAAALRRAQAVVGG